MESGKGASVVVATRSPLLAAGLAQALRDEGVPAQAAAELARGAGATSPADGTSGLADAPGGEPAPVWIVDSTTMRRAQEAGARILVIHEEPPADSVPGLHLGQGIGAVVAALADDIATSAVPTSDPYSHLDELTDREREIVEHVAKGWTNQQVSAELGISANTVRTHLHNVMAKLAIANRRELATLVNRP